mmetsp:Transcript_6183/g.13651  ORF Transcript_6183/g.13651 Transcript_6183/m.13651 type:complete len:96 (-) Transcript_6183:2-289(-)
MLYDIIAEMLFFPKIQFPSASTPILDSVSDAQYQFRGHAKSCQTLQNPLARKRRSIKYRDPNVYFGRAPKITMMVRVNGRSILQPSKRASGVTNA